jgi:Flp pilus assembly protein TadG
MSTTIESADPSGSSRGRRFFWRDERGGIAILFAVSSTLIFAAVGGAVDYTRWMQAKRTTAMALDAAVLAGASTLQANPDDPSAAVLAAQAYYRENITGRVQLASDSVSFAVADNGTAIVATGTAVMDTTFLKVAGIDQLPVVNNPGTKASMTVGGPGGSNIEVAVMLDVTGSMCDDGQGPCTSSTKLDGLKMAAKDLIDLVVRADQSRHTSKVALVPFSTRVRVAPDNGNHGPMTAMTGLPASWSGWYRECVDGTGSGGSETGGNWSCNQYQAQYKNNWKIMPCVTDRFYNGGWRPELTDAAPAAGIWLNAHDGGRMPQSWDSTDVPPSDQTGTSETDPATFWNYSPWGCADVAEANEVMPLSSNRDQLKSRIDGLEAYGATAGALGTAFTWYMLSPDWGSIWGGNSVPGSYTDVTTKQANGAPVLRKVAILMTDGVYNTYRGWKGQDQQMVSDWAKQLCTNMKAAGIEIYTVGLALDQLSPSERSIAEATLRDCGTDVRHFYNTLTTEDLRQAFRDIGLRLSSVRLAN